jgi:hypothetical protein
MEQDYYARREDLQAERNKKLRMLDYYHRQKAEVRPIFSQTESKHDNNNFSPSFPASICSTNEFGVFHVNNFSAPVVLGGLFSP